MFRCIVCVPPLHCLVMSIIVVQSSEVLDFFNNLRKSSEYLRQFSIVVGTVSEIRVILRGNSHALGLEKVDRYAKRFHVK